MPSSSCSNSTAAKIVKAVTPNYPLSSRGLDLPPMAVVAEVTVEPDGKPDPIVIVKSSGNAAFDRATIDAARASSYTPKIENCIPVTSTNTFRATFWPENSMRFLIAPEFRPPQAWSPNGNATGAPGFHVFGEWTHGSDVIGTMGGFTRTTLQYFIFDKVAQIRSSGGEILMSAVLELCDEHLQGWELQYTQGGTNYAEVIAMDDPRIYDAYYYSTSASPDQTVWDSLTSLCPRRAY